MGKDVIVACDFDRAAELFDLALPISLYLLKDQRNYSM